MMMNNIIWICHLKFFKPSNFLFLFVLGPDLFLTSLHGGWYSAKNSLGLAQHLTVTPSVLFLLRKGYFMTSAV